MIRSMPLLIQGRDYIDERPFYPQRRHEYLDRGKSRHAQTGIHPDPGRCATLQTMDKTIGRIPVVGWILTDKNKSIITVYFEVKGVQTIRR